MRNEYKVDYRKDLKKIRKRRRLVNIIAVSLIIIVLIASICIIYNKVQNTSNTTTIENSSTNLNDNEENNNNSNNSNNNNYIDNNVTDNKVTDDSSLTDENIDVIGVIDLDNINNEKNSIKIEVNNSTSEKNEYVYGDRVPESEAVEDSYFDDAVFIGNSQIEGITIYSSMKNATVFAGKGIMVDTIFSKEVIKTDKGNRITIMEALSKEKYGKIYIMLGANELGWAFDYLFIEQYGKVIDELKKLQPNSKIYVNGVMPVSKEKSNKDKIYNNKNIDNYNKLIINMTKEKEVYYIDSKEALADSEGNLPKDAGSDGTHLNATYYGKWFSYLKTHTVN